MVLTLMTRRFAHCRDMKRAAALGTLLVLSGLSSLGGCHHFSACYGQICDEGAGGASDQPPSVAAGAGGRADTDPTETVQAGVAGAPGAAGASGEPATSAACQSPLAECDESTLTSCETNLNSDLHHCGACNVRCSGFCAAGKCHDFEVLTPGFDGRAQAGITVTDAAVYALVDPDDLVLRHLVRYDKVAESTDTLQLLNQRPDHVLAGIADLYLFHDDTSTVWRVDDANVIKVDALKATSMTLIGSWLYAAGASGIVARDEGSHSVRAVPLPASVKPDSSSLELASNGHTLVLLTRSSEASTTQYGVYRLDTSATDATWQPVGAGAGTPTRLRVTAHGAYVLTDLDVADADGQPQELREHAFDGASQVLLRAAHLRDFAIDDGLHVYLASQADRYSLLVMSLADPRRIVDYPMNLGIDTLELDAQHLYVGSRYDFGLGRLPVIDF